MSKNQLSLIFGLTAFGRKGVTPRRSNLKNGRCLLSNSCLYYALNASLRDDFLSRTKVWA